jgi:hypothetical protein
MTPAIAIEKRLESEIARALEIMGHVRDRPEGLNEADTKAAFIDPILSALGWELRDPFFRLAAVPPQIPGQSG